MIKKRKLIHKRTSNGSPTVTFTTMEEKVAFVKRCFAYGVFYLTGGKIDSVTRNWPTYPDLILYTSRRRPVILNTRQSADHFYQVVTHDNFIQIIKKGAIE